MQQANKERVYNLFIEQGVLPMFSHSDEKISLQLLKAVYDGGMRIIEFTNRSPEALNIFVTLKKYATEYMPGLTMGAGTIMNVEQAQTFVDAGAEFIVAPVITEAVGEFCKQHNLLWCPGAATLTEIVHAHELGADIVKIFPAEQLGGPAFVKAIMAPCPWLRLLVTGSVTTDAENLKKWFAAGVKCAGIGSKLFSNEIIKAENFELITQEVKQMLQAVQSFKKK